MLVHLVLPLHLGHLRARLSRACSSSASAALAKRTSRLGDTISVRVSSGGATSAFLAVRQTVACTVALLFVRVLVGLGAIGQELYAYVHMVTRESRISR